MRYSQIRLYATWSFLRGLAQRGSARSIAATTLAGALYLGSMHAARSDVIGQAQVIDGDTIRVSGERVRLYGIDAPESGQSCTLSGIGWPCGQNAARMLTSVTDGQVVTCKGNKRDRYGRLLAVCYVGVDDLNARMVREGWALAYRRFGSDYVPQEVQARSAGSGIWRGQFVAPWEWRRLSRDSE